MSRLCTKTYVNTGNCILSVCVNTIRIDIISDKTQQVEPFVVNRLIEKDIHRSYCTSWPSFHLHPIPNLQLEISLLNF